ncbi:MAG: dihydropteroate synthase [Planctomycetales bacterium]|jgi:dihydropteroate synthase
MGSSVRELAWQCGGRTFQLGGFPLIMGIVNVTPDSFSDGGNFLERNAAVDHALKLAEDGADILDIGGESTRPNAERVSVAEELRRVVDVVAQVRQQTDRLISIDTTKAEVARQALAAGADIVNDISGLTFEPEIVNVCAESDCGVICMHILGTPQTMQSNPHYDDVVGDVRRFLSDRLDALEEAGIARERVVTDPGIGFGKTAQHNVDLLSNIEALRSLDRPVLIGHSRKRFLAKVLGRPVEERTFGTIGVAIAVAAQGADMIRVHDVRETRDALLAWHPISGQC